MKKILSRIYSASSNELDRFEEAIEWRRTQLVFDKRYKDLPAEELSFQHTMLLARAIEIVKENGGVCSEIGKEEVREYHNGLGDREIMYRDAKDRVFIQLFDVWYYIFDPAQISAKIWINKKLYEIRSLKK